MFIMYVYVYIKHLIIITISKTKKMQKEIKLNPTDRTFSYDEVHQLLLSERERAHDIAYEFYKDQQRRYEDRMSIESKVAFVSKEIADECLLIVNAISGLSSSSNDTMRNLLDVQLKKYVLTKQLAGSYDGTQTPIERLRNLLSPYITFASIIHKEDATAEMIENVTFQCIKNNDHVKEYLSDLEGWTYLYANSKIPIKYFDEIDEHIET